MESLKYLVCTVEQTKKLVMAGIFPKSILYWNEVNGAFIVNPNDDGFPAWTLAELNAFIGPHFPKPDFWAGEKSAPRHLSKSAADPLEFCVFEPDRMLTFQNAAHAAAHGLLYLLEGGVVTPQECNERYQTIFNRQ